jgi:hypothetical protein
VSKRQAVLLATAIVAVFAASFMAGRKRAQRMDRIEGHLAAIAEALDDTSE